MDFSVTDLACRRGDITVLEGVTFTAKAGEAVILRGPNGAGKTTLLRCLAGLTPPVAGETGFGADDVAYGGHSDGLKTQLSGLENLRFWASVYGSGALEAAIAQFDLAPLLERQTQYMSAGQKRRLSLARLMLTGRALWALDEPTVSLDAQNVARFAEAVGAHLDKGGAAIIATHIDLGLSQTRTLDVTQFKAQRGGVGDNPFLDEALA
ncbi:MAG: heme ABC exporter ATP-binding protein CcmA [Paracoccaceae bacterium]